MTVQESELERDEPGVYHSLGLVYAAEWPDPVRELLFAPSIGRAAASTIADGFELIELASYYQPPGILMPLAIVDEGSVACVVMEDNDYSLPPGTVVRWHLSDVQPDKQLRVIDIDPLLYVDSLASELKFRTLGLDRVLDKIGPAYEQSHLKNTKRPRDYVVRPMRIACQNVIIGLAAIAQDATFDGLSVVVWQTCEVPHVATHEANRALAALTLCDAFQNGGTMEIRFDRDARVSLDGKLVTFQGHPEGAVPASLRRFGRTVGVILGADDPAAITPSEARELFLAVTPMPPELRTRVDEAIQTRGITPERLCFSLLSQVWREPELDFILATTARARSILDGGAAWTDRISRQAESEVCRAAVMVGMLFRRLDTNDTAGDSNSAVRVVEDRPKGVTWHVDDVNGSVTFSGLDSSVPLPWAHGIHGVNEITVFPRTALTSELVSSAVSEKHDGFKVILVPADVPRPSLPSDVVVLRCPERLADLDKNIERRLLASRISRR